MADVTEQVRAEKPLKKHRKKRGFKNHFFARRIGADKKSHKQKKAEQKAAKKAEAAFAADRGFVNPFGYRETDPYLFVGNRVFSIFDIIIQYGTNNPAKIGWVKDIIPRNMLRSGEVVIVQRQRGMPKKTEDEIIAKKLKSSMKTTENTKTDDAREESQNHRRVDDMQLAIALSGHDDEDIIDSDLRLMIKAKTPQRVEQVLEDLKKNYQDHGVHGIIFVRRTGTQMKELRELLGSVSADGWHAADMATVSAGRLFLPSSGFSDRTGVYVGTDEQALITNNPALIDFYMPGGRAINAIVFMGGVRPDVSIGGLAGDSLANSGGTAVSHVLTEPAYLDGKRVHHIVLSPDMADYHAPDSLYFDLTKETINPLEVFGTPETVEFDAPTTFEKFTRMALILGDSYSDQEKFTMMQKTLIDWFIYRANGSGMYTTDVRAEPLKANRILATADHEHYPTPLDFQAELIAQANGASNMDPETARNARFLRDTMEIVFRKYNTVFGQHTTLPDTFTRNDRNIYYDLSKVREDRKLKGVMLINTLAYVTHRALEGEVIVVDGLDSVDIPPESIRPYKERMQRKNIGLVTVFEEENNKKVNPETFAEFCGRLSVQDVVVLGGLNATTLDYITKSWHQSLPKVVSDRLLDAQDGILYFYRATDHTGALINTHLVL